MPRPPLKDAVLHQIARYFFVAGMSVKDVVAAMARDGTTLSAQQIYHALGQMHARNVIQYLPLGHSRLEDRIRAQYPKLGKRPIHVVHGAGAVPIKAAQLAFEVLLAEWRDRDRHRRLPKSGKQIQPIGIGLGPGSTTRDFARHIRPLLEERRDVALHLSLFALAAGAPAENPDISPISFFNEFPRELIKRKFGLFASNLVRVSDYEQVKKTPGVVEAYGHRDEIFLYVTSMGDPADKNDWFRQFLRKQSVVAGRQVSRYRGNVQYRPYNERGPVREAKGHYRAVTLVELDELVDYARDRHVILMARGKSPEAMRPLLTRLILFSQIVMDVETAAGVVGRDT